MKKWLVCLSLCCFCSFSVLATPVTNIRPNLTSTNQLPKYIDMTDDEVRWAMFAIFNSSIDMNNILVSTYRIVSARTEDGWVYVTVKRHTMQSEIKIGKFEKVKEVSIEGGLLKVKYDNEVSFGWKEFGIGAGVGVVLTIIVSALNK